MKLPRVGNPLPISYFLIPISKSRVCRPTLSALTPTLTPFPTYPMPISYDDFRKVEMHVGRITAVDGFPEARKPAYKLTIDFGAAIGTKKSSAQITTLYKKDELIGRLVICVTNFPPKQIGPFISEVLTLGTPDADGNVVLLGLNGKEATVGGRIY